MATVLFNCLDLKTESSAGFADLNNHWAGKYVARIVSMGIMAGNSPDEFAPDEASRSLRC